MAVLAVGAASLYPTGGDLAAAQFYSNGVNGRLFVTKRLKLTLIGNGGATNTIGAAALGFVKLIACSNLWDADNSKGYPAVIDPVNNVLLLLDGAAAPAPVDVTTTAGYITVKGTY